MEEVLLLCADADAVQPGARVGGASLVARLSWQVSRYRYLAEKKARGCAYQARMPLPTSCSYTVEYRMPMSWQCVL